jgi:hypothetical protein
VEVKRKGKNKDSTLKIVELVPYSFNKDFILVCSIGLNIGFAIGLFLI